MKRTLKLGQARFRLARERIPEVLIEKIYRSRTMSIMMIWNREVKGDRLRANIRRKSVRKAKNLEVKIIMA